MCAETRGSWRCEGNQTPRLRLNAPSHMSRDPVRRRKVLHSAGSPTRRRHFTPHALTLSSPLSSPAGRDYASSPYRPSPSRLGAVNAAAFEHVWRCRFRSGHVVSGAGGRAATATPSHYRCWRGLARGSRSRCDAAPSNTSDAKDGLILRSRVWRANATGPPIVVRPPRRYACGAGSREAAPGFRPTEGCCPK